jgi:AraC-like DNA-binding protein
MKNKTHVAPEFFSLQVSSARRFYLNLQPSRGTKLAVVCGGVEQCASDYEIRRETFPFYSIEYVARGEGWLTLGKRRYDLKPGTIFCYAPDIRQHIRSNPQKPMLKYFIDFAGTQSNQTLKNAGLAPGKVSKVFPPNEIQTLFDELIHSGQRGSQHSPELCLRLLGCLSLKLLDVSAPVAADESAAFVTYHNCRQFILENFQRVQTLSQAAHECHVDAAYLCRLFRRFDHQTPYLFLTRLKMNEAAGLLQQPGALVKNVAADLGFANPFHFSRVFKSVMGISPEKFRKMR